VSQVVDTSAFAFLSDPQIFPFVAVFVAGGFSEDDMPKKTSVAFRVGKVLACRRGQVWYLCYHEHGQRRRPRVGPNQEAARQFAAQINVVRPKNWTTRIGVFGYRPWFRCMILPPRPRPQLGDSRDRGGRIMVGRFGADGAAVRLSAPLAARLATAARTPAGSGSRATNECA